MLPTALTFPKLAIYPVFCLVWEYMVDFRRIQILDANCFSTNSILDLREYTILDYPSMEWMNVGLFNPIFELISYNSKNISKFP